MELPGRRGGVELRRVFWWCGAARVVWCCGGASVVKCGVVWRGVVCWSEGGVVVRRCAEVRRCLHDHAACG